MKLLLLFLLSGSVSANAFELMSLKDFLKSELSGMKLTKEKFVLDESQIKELRNLAQDSSDTTFTFYYGRNAKGQLQVSCTSVPQKGKEGPMLLGVCFDSKGLLSQVKVLNHVEERGQAISEQSFLSQFSGKSSGDAFEVGKDVSGISGATWSSKAVSEALRKASYAYKNLVGKK